MGLKSFKTVEPLKTFLLSIFLLSSFGISANAGVTAWQNAEWTSDSATFFSSTLWANSPSGANFTENFVSSGGLRNFSNTMSFRTNSFDYGSGSLLNNLTIARTDGTTTTIAVDTTSSGFNSFDAPGSSNYLWIAHSGGVGKVKFSFSQPIDAFAFRLGDFADSTTSLYTYAEDSNGTKQILNGGNQSYLGWNITFGFSGSNAFGNNSWGFLGYTFSAPVTAFYIENDFGNDNWGIDTVSFSTVPEPSALSLLAVGLGGLAMMRRRRS